MRNDTKVGLALLGAWGVFCIMRACAKPLEAFGTAFEQQTIHYYERLLDAKVLDVTKREEILHELAAELGAGSVRRTAGAPVRLDEHATVTTYHDALSESELVNNIHYALQTRSSLSALRLAAQSNVITFFAALGAGVIGYLAGRSKSRTGSN